jgi:hypothetical protein
MSIAALIVPLALAGSLAFITDEDGVRVSMRTGTKDIEIVADGSFDATPERVLAAMIDYERAPSWQKQLRETKILRRDAHSLDVYERLKLPIISDRDYTLHVTWGGDDRGSWMRFARSNDGPAPIAGVVRMPVHEGTWRLDRGPDGRTTRAHYEVHMDLGGSLPAGMARKSVAKSIPDFFVRLRGQLKP